MASKKTAVFGSYSNVGQAERAVDELMMAAFSNSDVSVLLPDNESTREFAHEKNTKAPEGTTTGVAAGGGSGDSPWLPPRFSESRANMLSFEESCTSPRKVALCRFVVTGAVRMKLFAAPGRLGSG